MICRKSDEDSALKASSLLRKGKIVILPTDTVYGFSGIADGYGSGIAFKTAELIRRIKGRSESKPMIELIARPEDIYKYTDTEIPLKLLEKWPGALTLIVKNKNSDKTTAFRCPGDAWLRSVIAACGFPIYSTSVNRSGRPVLNKISEICLEFEKDCDLIVDSGDTEDALPSTIVSLVQPCIKILRQGEVKVEL
ncbi:L-threonylcarbamoyladenylate synthase [Treponema parvum]|uniref:L-threonylcarbamoyladenylate synthase n=1 Tax=Treponema parvum TaxID=138851 RepID=A0A975ID35_9SPIR|nr:L-threonylcarbamoyladenylate synthase [Treponema parvum]QTQ11729.1 L-threonylcarbamoyladenylate synthase [Treponema parvum]QTQ16326.1 L-threonylcarbamoyladenylate synthase [Treponema parvum]